MTPEESDRFDLALRIAVRSHDGRRDKGNDPAILHALRVGMAGEAMDEQIVGFLHDTVEDGELDVASLRRLFPVEIADAVMALTRETGERYADYIERVAINPLARKVKLRDLRDHLAFKRIDAIPVSQAVRYAKAMYRLEQA